MREWAFAIDPIHVPHRSWTRSSGDHDALRPTSFTTATSRSTNTLMAGAEHQAIAGTAAAVYCAALRLHQVEQPARELGAERAAGSRRDLPQRVQAASFLAVLLASTAPDCDRSVGSSPGPRVVVRRRRPRHSIRSRDPTSGIFAHRSPFMPTSRAGELPPGAPCVTRESQRAVSALTRIAWPITVASTWSRDAVVL